MNPQTETLEAKGRIDEAVVQEVAEFRQRITVEMARAIVGQKDVIDLILTALLSGGHCLLTGVPGLAKTLIVRCLRDLLDLKFNGIQFTPDLMPTDILGTEILEEDKSTGKRAEFERLLPTAAKSGFFPSCDHADFPDPVNLMLVFPN
ncbi:MoxR family ATPase [bacterium]|nr:MoxR family ATPase [bacterium]